MYCIIQGEEKEEEEEEGGGGQKLFGQYPLTRITFP